MALESRFYLGHVLLVMRMRSVVTDALYKALQTDGFSKRVCKDCCGQACLEQMYRTRYA